MTGDDHLRTELEALERSAPSETLQAPGGSRQGRWLRVGLAGATVVAAAALTVFALGPLQSLPLGAATPSPNPPAMAEARVGDFILTVQSAQTVWTTDEPIDISATLRYVGEEGQVTLGGGGIGISLIQQTGGNGELIAAYAASCRLDLYTISPNNPFTETYRKSGRVYDEAPFDEAFFGDPELRLPAGRWLVVADASLGVDDCNGLDLEVSMEIEVVASEASPAPTVDSPPDAPDSQPSETTPIRVCAAGQAYGVLDADADGNPILIMGDGMPTVSIVFSYPEDVVIESTPVLTIYDRDRNVLAREGDEVKLGGGFGADDTFHACGVISSDSNPPPSIECRMSEDDCDKALQALVGITDLADPDLTTIVVSGGTARTWHAEVHACWADGRYELYDVMGPIGTGNPQLAIVERVQMPPRLCD